MYIIVIVLSIKFILNYKLIHALVVTPLLLIISALLEYVGSTILTVSLGGKFDYTFWTNNFPNSIVLRIIGIVLYLGVSIAIYYMKIKVNIPEDISRKRSFSILANTIISAILIIPNMLYFLNNSNSINLTMVYFNIFAVFILLVLCFYNSIKSSELEAKRQEVEFQKIYIKSLDDIIDGLRGFKHDYNNNVQAIGGYLALNDIKGLNKYYCQMQSETRKINNTIPLNKFVKNNPALYGLLLSKISFAEVKDIQFIINIMDEYNIDNVKVYELCKILGILLDNALEAAYESAKRYVELSIRKDQEGMVIIEIINSFEGELNIEMIFENGFTTKKNHSGFGLWEVKKIISNTQKCSLKTLVSGNLFTQRLEVA
ncbi:MAG: GHKL domain-containing protein [Bacillota bacterium]|nr:GHKL domain-containing protein [Bacillota bacterium]